MKNLNFRDTWGGGFTLIELLLVVSIITLISSIVLASLGESRQRANFVAVKQQIDSIRTESEIYYTANSRYSINSHLNVNCPSSVNVDGWGFLGTEKGVALIDALKKNAGNVGAVCSINPESWAISVGTINLGLTSNSLIKTAYAANDYGFICFDSSNSVVVSLNSNDSDGIFRNGIALSNISGKFICNL